MSNDNRIVERNCCELEATIAVEGTGVSVSCLITDISEYGARLEVASDEDLPSRFDLLLPIDADIVDRRAVELRWRRDHAVGVRFEQA